MEKPKTSSLVEKWPVTVPQAASMLGVTIDVLQNLRKRDLCKHLGKGRGSTTMFRFRDLLKAYIAVKMTRMGIKADVAIRAANRTPVRKYFLSGEAPIFYWRHDEWGFYGDEDLPRLTLPLDEAGNGIIDRITVLIARDKGDG